MTAPNPEPLTARHALALAFDIVRTPCSAAETQRAEVLLGIASELRQAADVNRMWPAARPPEAEPEAEVSPALRGYLNDWKKTSAGEDPITVVDRLRAGATQALADFHAMATEQRPDAGFEDTAVTVAVDPSVTQRLPIVWSVGDKADCRHCHTPIEFRNWPLTIEGDPVKMAGWRHRYTGQAVCATPVMAPDPTGGAESQAHTFAAPVDR